MIGRARSLLVFLFLATLLSWTSEAMAQSQKPVIKIGVLAFRGTESAITRWQPLADYLSDRLNQWRFELTPVTLVSAPGQIEAQEIDFLITNPGHYVTLSEKYNLSALATLERGLPGTDTRLLKYGSVIFVRDDSSIHGLGDLKGKRVAAVSPQAFGGYQIAWREFKRVNIDPTTDLKSTAFMGFPQDAIIDAVVNGKADAGITRSGLLESLIREGNQNAKLVRVLQGNTVLAYPHKISSQLYPEWPFASLPGTDKILREKLVLALLATQQPEIASTTNMSDRWSAPLSYSDVRRLIAIYEAQYTHSESSLNMSNPLMPLWFAGFALLGTGLILAIQFSMRNRAAPAIASPAEDPPVSAETEETIALFESLTRRENQILNLICQGKTSKEIGQELGISPKTVEYHRANLLHKTHSSSTPQLVRIATQLHLDQVYSPGPSR